MKTAIQTVIEQKTKKIVDKGESMSNVDLYNLCILNRAREAEQKNNKKLNTDASLRQPGEGYGNCDCGTEGCCQCNPW